MKHELKIYWTSVEFKLNPLHKDFKKIKGGFVYAFTQSKDKTEALRKFNKELEKHNLTPSNFEFTEPYENIEWQTEEEEKHFRHLIEKIRSSQEVILDDFYMYEDY